MAVETFLKTRLKVKPGRIVTTDGREIGEHKGLVFYTIGQRQGMGISAKEPTSPPYYVVGKDEGRNFLIVGHGDDPALFSKEALISKVNWISGKTSQLPIKCQARIRYRQSLQRCRVEGLANADLETQAENSAPARQPPARVRVIFDEPQRAVTSGQSAVLYDGDNLIGGGVID